MIDVNHQINAVTRRVGSRTLDVGEARVVVLSQTYTATVDELWDACTNPERIPRWFLPVSGDLQLGGRYQLEGNAGGTITECEPPHRFAATWEFGGGTTWIEVRLSDEGGGRSRFELEHVAPVDAHWEEFGPGAVGIGWDLTVMGLTLHLESGGAPVDGAAVMAWTVSPDGRRFMSESSAAWQAADIADGTDPEIATAAAARTLAAYTEP
jgi:uncharacterized protein YndB with AHSA1/START domain